MYTIDDIQIFVTTHNRASLLKETLQSILAQTVSIPNITVLDNESTDNTAEIVLQLKDKGVHYVHTTGFLGNFKKAQELVSRPYCMLFHDDNFDWTQWDEVEKALNSDIYDIVMTTYASGFRNETIPYILNEMCFVPSAIYKTSNIDDTVMTNAYAMAHNLLPYHALGIKIINNNGKIFLPKGRVVLQGKGSKSHHAKKLKPEIYRRLQTFSLLWGYIDSYSLITNKKLRYQCMDVLCLGKSFFCSMLLFMKWFPFTWQNWFDIFYYVSFKQKIKLIFATIIAFFPISFYHTDKDIRNSFVLVF